MAAKSGLKPKSERRPNPSQSAAASPKATSRTSPYKKKTIALVYDFDGTLSPKPMQEYTFLPKIGQDPKSFWAEVGREAKKHEADGLITYMHLMYKKAKERGVRIDRDELVALGHKVEYFPGVEDWFARIEDYIHLRAETPVNVRHYLVSAGLQEIVEGTSIYPHFHNVFASEYFFEAYDLPYPKRVVTDTNKTQYLFRINKGVESHNDSINSHMDEDARPIPFENMIYFGDGDTDVPSMAVMRKNGGHAVAVHPPRRSRKKCEILYDAGRIDFFAPADYRNGTELFKRTCLLLDKILINIRIAEERWRLGRTIKR